jgi:apolipoprotein N-acyltransferase
MIWTDPAAAPTPAPPSGGRVWVRTLQSLAAIALSALLIGAAAPGIGGHAILAWVAFAPWLASLQRQRPAWAFLSGAAMGLAYTIPGRWDTFAAAVAAAGSTGWRQQGVTLLLFAFYALPFAVFGALDAWLRRRKPDQRYPAILRAGLLASLVCALWSPFSYTPVAIIIDATPMLQLGAIGGEPLLLLLLLWPSAVLAGLAYSPRCWPQRWVELVPVVTVLMAVAVHGSWRLRALDRAEAAGAGLRLSALPLQLDLPPLVSPESLTRDRAGAAASALELSRTALKRAPHCEVVVWPETPLALDHSERVCALATGFAQSLGRPLLMQCFRPTNARMQVSAEWMTPDVGSRRWHGKTSLVPLYERPLFGEGRFAVGTDATLFDYDDKRRLIPALCYELHARAYLRRGVQGGGNFIVHMSSFTPFSRHPIDVWDMAMSRLRAIEFGVPIVRAANRAPAGWIDAAGRERQMSARFGRSAECIDAWSPANGPTFYAEISSFAAWLQGALLLTLACWRRAPGAAQANAM